MAYFLGIDAGGTKADYVLGDDTTILARVRSGSIKRMRVEAHTAAEHFAGALAALEQATGVSPRNIAHTCIGTAGESVPLVADWLREEHARHIGGDLLLLSDVEVALDAAFPGAPGVLVLAGTGSNVAGRDAAGTVSTAGGWGPLFADQGSGYRIGVQAMRAVFLAVDEGQTSALHPVMHRHFGTTTIGDLVGVVNHVPTPDMSLLSPLVLACAEAGDALAHSILAREGRDLGYLARLMLRRLAAASPEPAPVALAGSILEHNAFVRDALFQDIQAEFPATVPVARRIEPPLGALWRARRA